jgi:hypothetical protein
MSRPYCFDYYSFVIQLDAYEKVNEFFIERTESWSRSHSSKLENSDSTFFFNLARYWTLEKGSLHFKGMQ